MPATYVLVPGAGGQAWYWHRVVPLLERAGHRVIAIDLPADDDSADFTDYAAAVRTGVDTSEEWTGPVILVAQSMGAFTAPLVADQLGAVLLLLVNPMVPAPGESAGQWWSTSGQQQAMVANLQRIGLGRNTFDSEEDFFHDTPETVRADAMSRPEPAQSDTPFGQPWPLQKWPQIPTAVIQGVDDRLFPLEFQRRIVRMRLGVDLDEMPGGHLVALSRPDELVQRLERHRVAAGF